MKKYYITTPIYYPSAKLHIGHAYTTIAGDVLARYKKHHGYDVFYLTGTDEHGQKIEEAAQKLKQNPQIYVDNIVKEIKKTWNILNIKYDKFIRTTDKEHVKTVQKIFTKLLENDDIYLDKYEGLYCTSDEAYYTQTQAENNKCPDCGKELKLIKEESYFFRCSKYIDKLLKFYEENPDFLEPQHRLKELINNFIEPGLEDLAISRTTFKWGIPIKENEDHIIYVWMDALTNYITALGYLQDNSENFNKYWAADVQLLGKEIIRFHAIYWPMFLMALDLPLPKKLFAHGWLLMENDKMSKSKGNIIYPDFLIDNYGEDTVRYYLMREVPFGADGQFTPTSYINRINNDIVNDLSNLINRTIAMSNQYLNGRVNYNNFVNDNYIQQDKILNTNIEEFNKNMDNLKFSKALENIWKIISNSNKLIDLEQPWILGKDVENNKEKLNKILWTLANNLNIIGNMLNPFMPQTTNKLFSNFNIEKKKEINDYKLIHNKEYIVKSNPEIIYQRLNAQDEIKKITDKMKEDLKTAKSKLKEKTDTKENVPRGTIQFSDFEKIDFKIGLVLECIKHPKADKLLIFKIKTIEGEKQIISGLASYYQPEELINKKILIVNNLEKIKLRGEKSEGMILTTEYNNKVKVIEINTELESLIK